MSRRLLAIAGGLIGVVVIAYGVYAWMYSLRHVTTDDAYVEGSITAIGFARGETVAHQMRVVRQVFARARLTPAEATQWRGICHQVLWAARQNGPDGV